MTEIEIYTAFCMVALFSVTLLMCIYTTRMEKRRFSILVVSC